MDKRIDFAADANPDPEQIPTGDTPPGADDDNFDGRTDADFDAMAQAAAWDEAVESGPVM
jgi:hypothetical protein